MNKAFAGVLIVAAALAGCSKSSEKGGGAANDTFKIVVPATATEIKQGELQTVRVTLERGEGFKQRVKLEMEAPAGIETDLNNATVEPGDKGDIQLTITVAKDAPLGEHKITVKGTPDKGVPTSVEFKVKVVAP